ncbi:MAG: hypothetical protein ABFR62_07695 [Bacteroidota bacterium]
MRNLKFLLFILLILGYHSTKAQYYESKQDTNKEAPNVKDSEFKDRIHFGGNFGAQFGDFTAIIASPTVYYDVSNMLMAGFGLNYIYQKYEYFGKDFSSSIYGTKFLLLAQPIKSIILSTEFERNYYDRNYNNFGERINPYWLNSWYVGAGYAVPMGKRGSFVVSFSYDLLHDSKRSYYNSPWRPGVGFYF